MNALSIITALVIACLALTPLAATIPVQSDSTNSAVGTRLSPPSTALNVLNLTTIHVWPWPKAPWAYKIPGHPPQHLLFDEIGPEDTGIDGQQSTLHACDEIVRWLWGNYKEGQTVDRACVQKTIFHGEMEGHVVMVLVPITISDHIDRELALDSVRALETQIWRYGGHSLECEIWSGGRVRGRISISIKVLKTEN